MRIIIKCRECGKSFDADQPMNIGTYWHPTYRAICPTCGASNLVHSPDLSIDIDRVISDAIDDKLAAKRSSLSVQERVDQDKVLEYWVQQYVIANYTSLGFKALEGPFGSGPDFRVLYKGRWTQTEVEVVCENYVLHKHHTNSKWAKCRILIVLSGSPPSPELKPQLPNSIIHIDRAHFTEWYRLAARQYAEHRQA